MAKDAPGDKAARKKPMPLSKHTIKYRKMFGDEFQNDANRKAAFAKMADKRK